MPNFEKRKAGAEYVFWKKMESGRCGFLSVIAKNKRENKKVFSKIATHFSSEENKKRRILEGFIGFGVFT